MDCTKWIKQYVGEMENALHVRMNDHQLDIMQQRLEKPVAGHFNSEGHSLQDHFMQCRSDARYKVNAFIASE